MRLMSARPQTDLPQNRELQQPMRLAYSDASELLTLRARVS